MTIAQLVQAMEEPATEDLRGDLLLPTLLKAIGTPKSPALQRSAGDAQRLEQGRRATGATSNRDGIDEETPAIELMDAWWPKLVTAEFKPALGKKAFERLQGMLQIGDSAEGSPHAPAFSDGWWGYVYKDLRDLFGPKPKGAVQPRATAAAVRKSKCRRPAAAQRWAKRSR